ncbi:MAG: CZB domain-containing protein [Bacteriovoracaceae bacterium]|nr:CZB domain-containing protein [Bacteroidota bacterium]
MGVLHWLKDTLAGKHTGELKFDSNEESFEGLNMKEVITAHLAWKDRLERLISGVSTENLDPEIIQKDNHCALGKWIEQSEEKFKNDLEFIELRETHKEFHKYAAQVVSKYHEGDFKGARERLDSEVNMFSNRVQLKIILLYKTILTRKGLA